MPGLEDDLTLDNVVSFAEGCMEVARLMAGFFATGRNVVVLPSRGAWPIYKTADHELHYFGDVEHRSLVLPFTADSAQGLSSGECRRHWVRVLHAESSGVPNGHWQFYRDSLVRHGEQHRTKPHGFGSFVLIDTAISGRAATEILDELDACGADYHLIVVADRMGERLKPEYRANLLGSDRVSVVNVRSLYTEDRGIALMGGTTVTFPSRTRDDKVDSLWVSLDFQPVMFWTLEHRPQISNISDFYAHLHALHFHASKVVEGRIYSRDDIEVVEYFLRSLLENTALVSRETTESAFQERYGSSGKSMEVSSSMFVRVYDE